MKLLAVDGNSILNRAYYGIRLLTTQDGVPTNGIYGFLTMLEKVKEEVQPDAVAIAFDVKAPTFRHKEYDGYKAQRKGMPEDLACQLPLLKELLTHLGYRIVTCEGYEADDILGTFAAACTRAGEECVIATGDRDSLQLVGPHVSVRLAFTKAGQPQAVLYDEEKIREEYGVSPPQLLDIKALMGDSSDNIPGVAGIGQKGAASLIQTYGSIQQIYDHLDELDLKPALYKKLSEGKESAFLSYRLGKIHTEVPIPTELDQYVPSSGDPLAAAKEMERLELFSLMKKMGISSQATAASAPKADAPAIPAVLWEDAQSLLETLRETKAAYFLCHYDAGGLSHLVFLTGETVSVLPVSALSPAFLTELFGSDGIQKYTWDCKSLYRSPAMETIPFDGFQMDALLAGYVLNPSHTDYSLPRLAAEYQAHTPGRVECPPSWDEPLQRLAAEVVLLPSLCEKLEQAISQNDQQALLHQVEIPLSYVLARMESLGFAVDADSIAQYGKTLGHEIEGLQDRIYENVGYSFNLNSPKQLGEALFDKLGLRTGKKTKTGYSTNAEVLESLRYDHPVVEEILQYRTLSKLKSTYCDGLIKEIGPDGRIHSRFNQTETRTGRISSTEPNLQNIPVRTEIGRELRRFFVAKEGCVLVDADYSQIELRVLAHVANDANMIQDFLQGNDIHRSTAAQVFHVPPDMVTPLMRSRAKAVNFGIVYGIGAFSLAKDIGVTRKEADQYIQNYLAHYSGVRRYMEQIVEQAREQGYVETIFGRRRYLPELSSSNFNLRSFGERVARNMPIQGAAADIIKIAMIRVANRLEIEGLQARLILQVHDELIVEAPEEEAEQAAAIVTEEMQAAISLSVPLVADSSVGKTWYDTKK